MLGNSVFQQQNITVFGHANYENCGLQIISPHDTGANNKTQSVPKYHRIEIISKIYKSFVVSVMTYSAETRPDTNKSRRKEY